MDNFLQIDENKLVLSGTVTNMPPKFEVCFSVTDSGAPPATREFHIILFWEDSLGPPFHIDIDFSDIQETSPITSQPVGSQVGNASAIHTDPGANLEFIMVDNGGYFGLNHDQLNCAIIQDTILNQTLNVPEGFLIVTMCTIPVILTSSIHFEDHQDISFVLASQDIYAREPLFQTFSVAVIDLNDPPRGVEIANAVDETVSQFQFVSPIVVDDPDEGQSHTIDLLSTYTSNNLPCAAFIVAENAELLVYDTECFNYFEAPFLILTFNVTDDGEPPLWAILNATISVRLVNKAPIRVYLNHSEILETAPSGTIVGALFVDDPDNRDVVRQSVMCKSIDPNSPFSVMRVPTILQMQPVSSPQISAKNILTVLGGFVVLERASLVDARTAAYHTVPLKCTDSGKPALSLFDEIRINVTAVNQPPTSIQLSGNRIAENLPPNTLIGFLSADDPDPHDSTDTITFCIVQSRPDGNQSSNGECITTDNSQSLEGAAAYLQITRNRLKTRVELRATDTPTLTVRIRATDSGGLWVDATFVIHVLGRTFVPPTLSFSPLLPVYENEYGTKLGYIMINGGPNDFEYSYSALIKAATVPITLITHGNLVRLAPTEALSFARTPVLTIEISATSISTPQTITVSNITQISVTDRNDPPSNVRLLSLLKEGHASSRIEVPEDTPGNTIIARFVVDDPDNTPYAPTLQHHVCTVLRIVDGTQPPISHNYGVNISQLLSSYRLGNVTYLRLEGRVEFHIVNLLLLTVKCTDSGIPPLSVQRELEIVIQQVMQPPEVYFEPSQRVQYFSSGVIRVSERNPVPMLIGQLDVHDPNHCPALRCGPPTSFSFEVVPPGFVQVLSDQRVVVMKQLDYYTQREYQKHLVVHDDGTGLYSSSNLSIHVINVNDPITDVVCLFPSISSHAIPGTRLGSCNVVDKDKPDTLFGQHELSVYWLNAPSSDLNINGFFTNGTTVYLNVSLKQYELSHLQLLIHAQDLSPNPFVFEQTVSVPVFSPEDTLNIRLIPNSLIMEEGEYVNAIIGQLLISTRSEEQFVSCRTKTTEIISRSDFSIGLDCSSRSIVNVSLQNAAIVLSGHLDFRCTVKFNVTIVCSSDEEFRLATMSIMVQDKIEPPYGVVFTPSLMLRKLISNQFFLESNELNLEYFTATARQPALIPFTETRSNLPFTLGNVSCLPGTSHGCIMSIIRATRTTIAVTPPHSSVTKHVPLSALVLQPDTGALLLLGLNPIYREMSVLELDILIADTVIPELSITVQVIFEIKEVSVPPRSVHTVCGCRDNPCQFGGQCIPEDGASGSGNLMVASYTCICPHGRWGQQCELIEVEGENGFVDPFYCLRIGPGVESGELLSQLVVIDDNIADTHSVTIGGDGSVSEWLFVTSNLDIVVVDAEKMSSYLRHESGNITAEFRLPIWLYVEDSAGLYLNVTAQLHVTSCAGVLNRCDAREECSIDPVQGVPVCECGPAFVFSTTTSRCEERICLHARDDELCMADTDTCASRRCQNGAACIDGTTEEGRPTFQCLCRRGFTGFFCELRTTICSEQTCWNGGTCVDQQLEAEGLGINNSRLENGVLISFTCKCPKPFHGAKCQYMNDACANSRCGPLDVCIPQPVHSFTTEEIQLSICVSQQNLIELELEISCKSIENRCNGSSYKDAIEVQLNNMIPDQVSIYMFSWQQVDDLLLLLLSVIDTDDRIALDSKELSELLQSHCRTRANASMENILCDFSRVVIVDTGQRTPTPPSSQPPTLDSTTSLGSDTESTTPRPTQTDSSSSLVGADLIVGFVFVALLVILLFAITFVILRRKVCFISLSCPHHLTLP